MAGLNKWPAWLLIALLLIPVLVGTVSALLPAFGYLPALGYNQLTTKFIQSSWQQPDFMQSVWLTLSTGLISTLVAVLLTIGALGVWFGSGHLKRWNRLFGPMLVIPHAAAAIALGFVLAPSGLILRLISPDISGFTLPPSWPFPNNQAGIAIIIALALKEMPFIFLLASSFIGQAQRKQAFRKHMQLASTLGFEKFSGFILVLWPQIYPMIRLPVIAVLIYSGSSIEIPLLLGPSSPATVSVTLLTSLNDVDLQQRLVASALAWNQIAVSMMSIVVWLSIERLGRWLRVSLAQPLRARRWITPVKYVAWISLYLAFSLIVISLLGILVLSVAGHWPFESSLPNSFTLTHWQYALAQLLNPFINTIALGIGVAALSVVLCTLTLETVSDSPFWKRLVTGASYAPLLVPMVVYMFGASFLISDITGRNSWASLFLLHFIVVTPYVWLSMSKQYADFDPRLSTLAKTLGAAPVTIFWKIKLPLMWSTFMLALALGTCISFSQYLPTLLGSSGAISTITTDAVAIASGGSRRLSAVYGIVQVLLPGVVFGLLWLFTRWLFSSRKK